MAGKGAVAEDVGGTGEQAAAPAARPKGWRLLREALRTRKAAVMLGFGFSSGLPFALLIGTLNAWLGEAGITLATIGVLSWIGLSYSFKFLWSPLIDRLPLPGLEALGRRRSWILLCQVVLAGAFLGIASSDPATSIGIFAVFAFFGALGSATQDVAVDAWRIDIADAQTPVELLTPVYQLGYRSASIFGGAFALFMAARMSWPMVFTIMAVVMAAMVAVTLSAPDTERPEKAAMHAALAQPGELAPKWRWTVLGLVGLSWLWAITTILGFMHSVLDPPAGTKPPSVADFTKHYGPFIVIATVIVPLALAGLIGRAKRRGEGVLTAPDPAQSGVRTAGNHLYVALVAPLVDLATRLGWGVLALIAFILTYPLCYNVWVSFALPFYLDFLHYTKDEVAFASKIFGIIMTMLGIGLAGWIIARFGKRAAILCGTALPIVGNFAYADLAEGGPWIDRIAGATGLTWLFGLFGFDERMVRLMLAISVENVATGMAGVAFVAYLSGIVSKQYTAVQYALLSSLTFLIGGLGRGIAGEAIDANGYAYVFRWAVLLGLVAFGFAAIEALRGARRERMA